MHDRLHILKMDQGWFGGGVPPDQDHGIDMRFRKCLVVLNCEGAYGFPQQSSDPRSDGCLRSGALANGHTQIECSRIARGSVRSDGNGNGADRCSVTPPEDRRKGTEALERPNFHTSTSRSARRCNGYSVTSLCATTIQNSATVLGCHASAETVRANAATSAWLIRAFHVMTLFNNCILTESRIYEISVDFRDTRRE